MSGNNVSMNYLRPYGIILSCLFALSFVLMLGLVNSHFQYLAVSACILSLVLYPLLKTKQFDLFSVWSWVIITCVIEVFLRSIYITFDIPNKDTIQSVFLLNETKDFLLMPALLTLSGFLSLTFGFMLTPQKQKKTNLRIFQTDEWVMQRFRYIMLIILILSWVGVYFFLQNIITSITDFDISKHRGLSTNLEEYRAYGYLRFMVNFSFFASLIIFVKILDSIRLKVFDLVILFLSIGTQVVFAFMVQHRGGIVVIFISMLAIYYYMHDKKIKFLPFIIFGYIALIIIKIMTLIRLGGILENIEIEIFNPLWLIEPAILGMSGSDISKIGHIVSGIPALLDFQYGETLIRFVFLWIPREIWPEKPVNLDTTIGMKIFGAETYGSGAVPPGFIAEMYLNFWIPGVILGCFILGCAGRRIYGYFKNNIQNRNAILLYVTCFMQLIVSITGSGFSSAMVGLLMNLIPMYIILHLITRKIGSSDLRNHV